jgi:hypothetical protein
MKMEQCKGMMDHSNMSDDTATKKQTTKTNVNQHRKFSTYQHPKVSSWLEEIRVFG